MLDMLQIRIKFTQCCKMIMLNYFPLKTMTHNIHLRMYSIVPLWYILNSSSFITKLVKC